jgi:YD repeat-containing protein
MVAENRAGRALPGQSEYFTWDRNGNLAEHLNRRGQRTLSERVPEEIRVPKSMAEPGQLETNSNTPDRVRAIRCEVVRGNH